MKSTISDVRQLFNITELAYNTTVENLTEGQAGIFPVDSDTSITQANAQFDLLPDEFRIISRVGGKIRFSQDCIEKKYISNQVRQDYKAQVAESWTVTPENCDCIKSAQIRINIDEDSLLRRDGLTWTHRDFVVSVAPKELECLCDCEGKGVYENNVMTKLLFESIQAINSPFYEAEVVDESNNVYTTVADIETFIETNKTVNTDDDDANDGEKLSLVIKGKEQAAGNYADLEVNYVYPRGVRLNPVLVINEYDTVEFTQTQELVYELNHGYDLRAEEFDCMSLYTDLNHYPQLSDGIASPNLNYQFENGKLYDTLVFEYSTKKVERAGDGDRKGMLICIGTESGTGSIIGDLETIFTP